MNLKSAILALIAMVLVGCEQSNSADLADRMKDWPFSADNREAMREDDLHLVASEIPIMRLWVLPSFDRAKVITLSGTTAEMRGLVKVSWGKGGALRGVAQQKPFTITATEAVQIEAILQKLGARAGKVSEEYFRPDGSLWLDGTQLAFEYAGPQGYHRFHRHAGDIDTLPGLLELSSIVMKAAGHSPNPADW